MAADTRSQPLRRAGQALRAVTLALHSYMPSATGRLLDALGEPGRGLEPFGSGVGGRRVERIAPLFPKLES